MVRSAVRLLGDVCRAIVVVDELGVVWVVTRTASRTLQKKPPEIDIPGGFGIIGSNNRLVQAAC